MVAIEIELEESQIGKRLVELSAVCGFVKAFAGLAPCRANVDEKLAFFRGGPIPRRPNDFCHVGTFGSGNDAHLIRRGKRTKGLRGVRLRRRRGIFGLPTRENCKRKNGNKSRKETNFEGERSHAKED